MGVFFFTGTMVCVVTFPPAFNQNNRICCAYAEEHVCMIQTKWVSTHENSSTVLLVVKNTAGNVARCESNRNVCCFFHVKEWEYLPSFHQNDWERCHDMNHSWTMIYVEHNFVIWWMWITLNVVHIHYRRKENGEAEEEMWKGSPTVTNETKGCREGSVWTGLKWWAA